MTAGGFPGFLRDLATILGGTTCIALLLRWSLSWHTWIGDNTLFRALELLTEPFLVPLRRHLPRSGGIDLSLPVATALVGAVTIFLRLLLTRGHT